eukprot:1705665-Alexandrium_andersonii.AAC.1
MRPGTPPINTYSEAGAFCVYGPRSWPAALFFRVGSNSRIGIGIGIALSTSQGWHFAETRRAHE